MPFSIRAFERLMFANILLFAAAISINPDTWRDRPSLLLVIAGISLISLVNFGLTVWASRQHANLARLVLLGMFLWGIHDEVVNLGIRLATSAMWESIRLTCRVLEAVGLTFVFLPSSNEWFPAPKPWTDVQYRTLLSMTWIALAALLGRSVGVAAPWAQEQLHSWLGKDATIAVLVIGVLVFVLGGAAVGAPFVLRALWYIYRRLVTPISRQQRPDRVALL